MNPRIRKGQFMSLFPWLLIVCWLFATGSAWAQSNLVLFISQPGDYIGQGQTYVTTNTADFSFSGSPNLVTVGAFGYTFWIGGPGGANLAVGTYANSARYPFNGSQPGLDVFGNGRGCNTDCGDFQIYELHTDVSGQIDRLWVTFSNRCECSFSPMTGEIRYASLLAPPAPVAKTIRVPENFATIQLGINNASPFGVDTVLVSPGTYYENISFNGKAVTVMSASGPQVTIIDGSRTGAVINFSSGEGTNSIVRGFTLQNGSSSFGSGISLLGTSPTIIGNIFQNNAEVGGYYGAAIGGNNASPVIQRNLFQKNSADGQYLSGVVSFINGSSPLIANNVFVNNSTRAINIIIPGGYTPIVLNNTIVSNSVGIAANSGVFYNNIVYGNATGVTGIGASWQRNLVYGGLNGYQGIPDQTGTNGNLAVDPLLTCLPTGDFHVLAGSPCIDAGTNGAPQLPTTDYDGTPRILPGTTNGTPRVDMGAFEFNLSSPPTPCLYVTCPSNMVAVAAVGQTSATVNYPAPTGAPVAIITNFPASGSAFPGGTNTVSCTASYGTNSVSCTFTITVLVPPSIISQSSNTNVLAGRSFSLSVTPGGSAPFTYRWIFENANISGGTSQTLTINNAQAANEGIYRVAVANAAGSVTSTLTM